MNMGPRWGLASDQGADPLEFFPGEFTIPPPPLQNSEQDAFIRKKAQGPQLSNVECGMRRSTSLPELKPRLGKLPPLPGMPSLPGFGLITSWSDSPEHLGFNLLGLPSKGPPKMDPRDRPTSRLGGPRPPRFPPPIKAIRRLLSDEDQANPLGFPDEKEHTAGAKEVFQQPAPNMKTLQLPPPRSKRRPSKKPVLPPILETAALKILSARSQNVDGTGDLKVSRQQDGM
eukprot:gnl/MRDRNA2_/MRDRNA2_77159_c0_seq1.p1 gnl/MRDRNA2_/MRDRNA2_77159_c0~~gnl/MRDRNA2_/MRDRNA2_77159_c0_seq1.p1  ORF type:complete len:229 (-),score=45.31 gnl/MRDRNA2_/MRDRNA2_77159_c0_seq1:37-723(-)